MKRWQRLARKLGLLLLALVVLYLALGLGFHVAWNRALEECRVLRRARGDFVEPEVLGGVIGLVFDMTFWPVYAGANLYHDGTPFATPCTHSRIETGSDVPRSMALNIVRTGIAYLDTAGLESLRC